MWMVTETVDDVLGVAVALVGNNNHLEARLVLLPEQLGQMMLKCIALTLTDSDEECYGLSYEGRCLFGLPGGLEIAGRRYKFPETEKRIEQWRNYGQKQQHAAEYETKGVDVK